MGGLGDHHQENQNAFLFFENDALTVTIFNLLSMVRFLLSSPYFMKD